MTDVLTPNPLELFDMLRKRSKNAQKGVKLLQQLQAVTETQVCARVYAHPHIYVCTYVHVHVNT